MQESVTLMAGGFAECRNSKFFRILPAFRSYFRVSSRNIFNFNTSDLAKCRHRFSTHTHTGPICLSARCFVVCVCVCKWYHCNGRRHPLGAVEVIFLLTEVGFLLKCRGPRWRARGTVGRNAGWQWLTGCWLDGAVAG